MNDHSGHVPGAANMVAEAMSTRLKSGASQYERHNTSSHSVALDVATRLVDLGLYVVGPKQPQHNTTWVVEAWLEKRKVGPGTGNLASGITRELVDVPKERLGISIAKEMAKTAKQHSCTVGFADPSQDRVSVVACELHGLDLDVTGPTQVATGYWRVDAAYPKPTMTPEQEAYGVANGLAATAAVCKRVVGFAHATYTMVVLVAAQLRRLGMEVTEPRQPVGDAGKWRIDAVWPRPGAPLSVGTGSCWTGDSICMTLATRARTSRRSVAWLTADEGTAQIVVQDLRALGMSTWGPKRSDTNQSWEVVAEWPEPTRVNPNAPPNTRELTLDAAAEEAQRVMDLAMDKGLDECMSRGLFDQMAVAYDQLGYAINMEAQPLPVVELQVSDHLWASLDEIAELIPRLVSALGFPIPMPEQAHKDRDRLVCDASRVLGQLALSRHLNGTSKRKRQSRLEDAVRLILELDEKRCGPEVVALCLTSRDQLRKAVGLEPSGKGLGEWTPQHVLHQAIAILDVMRAQKGWASDLQQRLSEAAEGLRELAGKK